MVIAWKVDCTRGRSSLTSGQFNHCVDFRGFFFIFKILCFEEMES